MSGLSASDVRVHRSGRGPALVLLHCLGVDHRLWDETVAALGPDCCSIRYDFPGHHEAPTPDRAYSISDLSEQLLAVLDAERVHSATIAGISLGGLVAQHFAAAHPERTERLVLIDTTPRYSETMQSMWAERARIARQQGVMAMADDLLAVWFTREALTRNLPAVRYVRDCFSRVGGEGYAKACEALAAADLRPMLADIQAPTMIVCGSDDVPEFLLAAQSFVRVIPGAQLKWLSPARHASVLEQPAQFAAALREFLAP